MSIVPRLPLPLLCLLLPAALSGCAGCAAPPPVEDAGERHDVPAVDAGPAVDVALLIEPAGVELVADAAARPAQAFRAWMLRTDGTRRDVGADATWSVAQRGLGTIDDEGTFTSTGRAGATTVTAVLDGREAIATVAVRVDAVFAAPPAQGDPLPADPDAPFAAAPVEPARAPRVVYPNDDVVLPPNLRGLEVQWIPASGAERLWAIDLESELFRARVVTRCAPVGAGCAHALGQDVWRLVAEQHRGLGPVTITVRGVDDAGTAQGVSSSLRASIAPGDLRGALYYWTTSGDTAILRVDVAAGDAAPEVFFPFDDAPPDVDPDAQPGVTECWGCHALSPDGRRMSISRYGEDLGRVAVLDVAERRVLVPATDQRYERFTTWDPTSRFFAGVRGMSEDETKIRIRDGETADVVEQIEIGYAFTHPDWSPQGDRIVFTRLTQQPVAFNPGGGGVSYVERGDAGWSAPVELVAAAPGKHRYYPATSPDGRIVVYDESTCPVGDYHQECDGEADPSATLWAVSSAGGAPVRLDRANEGGALDDGSVGLANSFPKWAPFVEARRADGQGSLVWLTFSSRRRYGLHDPAGKLWLWMVAVDPDRVLAGDDGSAAAFWIPFQDIETSNHTAQWARDLVKDVDDAGTPLPEAP